MGLKLRYNLFYNASPDDVFDVYSRFYGKRNTRLVNRGEREYDGYRLYETDGSWTILDWNIGWEWVVRREAQFYVSRELHCPGFLVFVFDGDYWGYEFFNEGVALDHFIQETFEHDWFPDEPCTGNAQLIASYFDWLQPDDIAPYLVRDPDLTQEDGWKLLDELDVPPRPGDEFTRFDELAALNFLRLLGIQYVTPQTPIWKTFWLEGPD